MNRSFYGFGPADDEARSYRPAGLTGARAASRLAGATTSGAPTAGSFRKGDALWGQDGSLWICTATGTPGTFVQAGFANPLSTKADVLVGGAAGVASRLGVGSDNQVLTADSTQTLGLKWAVTAANAGGALTQIAQTVLGGTAASITFSSIPGTYSSLMLAFDGRLDTTLQQFLVQFNADTGSNYDYDWIAANSGGVSNVQGVAATSVRIGSVAGTDFPASVSSPLHLTIVNYAGTTFQKALQFWTLIKNANSSSNIQYWEGAGFWRSTAAITSIKVFPNSGNFIAGSQATLYGIS